MSYECSFMVVGMELTCPMCQTVVKSGESHSCKSAPVAKKPAKRRVSRKVAKEAARDMAADMHGENGNG